VRLALLAVVALVALASCGRTPAGSGGPTAADPPPPSRWTFDADPGGGLPPGAVVFGGAWAVRAEPEAPSPPNALCQTGAAEFPAVALGDAVYTDVNLSTRFKPIAGHEQLAAGLMFRVRDRDNYYILRANALEGNVTLEKYAGGRRSSLTEGTAGIEIGQWQALRVEATGEQLRGFLNGQSVLEATDDTYTAGKVGLWTGSDAVACFDTVEAMVPYQKE
jgi:Domain of Unknown Function (DUF1080)